ncbi:MAG: peptidylprolyl isomerase [Clostridia bacterium]|nr:peptidylprolyl isomerase [Clostridia bacterium]
MKRIFALTLCLALLFSFTACGEEEKETGSSDERIAAMPIEVDGVSYQKTEETTDFVCIQMKSGGRILLELYPDVAPITVANFQKLVAQDFYNGLTFHRVIPGFMIQGGCPEGTGMGGPGWSIKGEFSANGVKNDLKHTRGVLSMARGSYSMDSAGSQFFIMHADYPSLNGQYAAFGEVLYGMDTVDQIAGVKTLSNDMPVQKQVMYEVYFMAPAAQ